mmetsp:Transcript_21487/g.69359  ORF Transcript_21487/g.69359 Transcript_21487/m.69359 type:complete len:235 (-) Transcript_21487:206-910(-)
MARCSAASSSRASSASSRDCRSPCDFSSACCRAAGSVPPAAPPVGPGLFFSASSRAAAETPPASLAAAPKSAPKDAFSSAGSSLLTASYPCRLATRCAVSPAAVRLPSLAPAASSSCTTPGALDRAAAIRAVEPSGARYPSGCTRAWRAADTVGRSLAAAAWYRRSAATSLAATSARACVICALDGSSCSPLSKAATESAYRPRPYSEAAFREYPFAHSGWRATTRSASASASV